MSTLDNPDGDLSRIIDANENSLPLDESPIFDEMFSDKPEANPPTVPDGVPPGEFRTFWKKVHGMYVNKEESYQLNRFPWQSQMISKRLLDFALEDKLNVQLCFSMPADDFYPRLRTQVSALLKRGASSVRIVFAQPPNEDQYAYWIAMRKRYSAKLKLHAANEYDSAVLHYCLVGDSAYRIEFPHEKRTGPVTNLKPERPARFSFNDVSLGKRIKTYSDQLARACPELREDSTLDS